MNIHIINAPFFSSVGVIWSVSNKTPEIVRILLSTPDSKAEVRAAGIFRNLQVSSCAEIEDTADKIKRFLEGETINFSVTPSDLKMCTEFQQRVLVTLKQIPRGTVSTYGKIAAEINIPNSARAVGNALANNPFPLILPCHRIIRSDNTVGSYQGGVEMKLTLLKQEGITFDTTGLIVRPAQKGIAVMRTFRMGSIDKT